MKYADFTQRAPLGLEEFQVLYHRPTYAVVNLPMTAKIGRPFIHTHSLVPIRKDMATTVSGGSRDDLWARNMIARSGLFSV
jgi:hypothetical protein